MTQVGDRVGAVLGSSPKGLELLGYGVYEGDFVPEEAVGFFAEVRRDIGGGNPRIRLDSGKVVYGCECWWGSEKKVKQMIEQFGGPIIEVDIDEVREQYRQKHGEIDAAPTQQSGT